MLESILAKTPETDAPFTLHERATPAQMVIPQFTFLYPEIPATALTIRSKQAFRALGRSVARVLQFVSNPSLLSNQIEFAHPDLLRAVLSEGDGPKLGYLLKKVRQLARNGHRAAGVI